MPSSRGSSDSRSDAPQLVALDRGDITETAEGLRIQVRRVQK
jgi:hypothetical protein